MPSHDSHEAKSPDEHFSGETAPVSGARDDASTARGQRMLRVLTGVLSIESVVMGAVVVLLVVEQFVATPASRVSSLALLGVAAVALALVIATFVGAIRRGPWVRGAAITWQILQLAAAWTIVQGDLAPYIGWGLTVLSLVGFVSAIHPDTRTALLPRSND